MSIVQISQTAAKQARFIRHMTKLCHIGEAVVPRPRFSGQPEMHKTERKYLQELCAQLMTMREVRLLFSLLSTVLREAVRTCLILQQ